MRRNILLTAGLIILIILTIGLLSCTGQSGSSVKANTDTNTTTSTATNTTTNTTPTATAKAVAAQQATSLASIKEVIAQVRPSVVVINVQVTTFDIFGRSQEQQGAGSGWFIRSDGYVVTNQHVVDGATNIVVITEDGNKYSARNVFTDAYTDLAVIKIDATGLPVLPTGDSTAISIGDPVIAIGNALGQGISATAGIVSAEDVALTSEIGQPLDNLIQTDAAINPGNSGGPLVNWAGEVIGITSVKISQVGVEGMGYALGINQALPVINTLISDGRVVRPYLGISVYTVDAQVSAYYNLSVESGVLITDVAARSPASAAGLRPGDIITGIDGNAQTDAGQLMSYIDSKQVGQEIRVTYVRGNDENTVTVTLAENPE